MWLFNMADEIKDRKIPITWWTIWDCKPTPVFNKPIYDTCDFLGCISKLTYGIMRDLGLEHKAKWIPHGIDANLFKPMNDKELWDYRRKSLGPNANKFVIFYNSRNARRKRTSDILKTTKELLNEVGQDKAFLLMKTDPADPEGGNLIEVAKMLDLKPDQVAFVPGIVPPEQLNVFYNISDITVAHSDNEGWGLSVTESLFCGTPVICTKTGGLQDQPIDDKGNVFGVMLEPCVRSLQGSQQIPYIYSDLCADKDWLAAYRQMYQMSWEDRKALGRQGAEWARSQFTIDRMTKDWDEALTNTITSYRNNPNQSRIKTAKV
jgi:glycosyltransferase involved in cell wall biosynthesis